MTLILRPVGRGNWLKTTMHIDGGHALPLLFRVGQRVPLGGVVFRVVEVILNGGNHGQ